MSLINDALKKAQRQGTVDAAGVAPPMPGATGTRVTRRSKPLASQSVLLIVAASATLIIISVVATVYLLREPAAPVTPPTVALLAQRDAAKPALVDSDPSAVSPIVFVPLNPPPETPRSMVNEPAAVSAPAPATTPIPRPVVTAPPPAPVRPSPVEPAPRPLAASGDKADERILDYIDKLHVLGVRSSGTDSRVLMNDRVYRVNDMVDRSLGLRLVEVQPGRLVFEDARGVRYTKIL